MQKKEAEFSPHQRARILLPQNKEDYKMAESNKMKEMQVNKLMVQMGIPMILSMALQAVYNIVDSAYVGYMC